MGEKKMADGFLAPTGKFYPKTENFHAQTARAWIAEHTEELSRKQQFDINNDETNFEKFYISNVRMFPWCKGCAEEKARDLWGNAQSEEKPKRCDACPAFRNRPL